MNIDTFFHEHPVFRHEEFTTWKNKQKEKEIRTCTA